MSEDLDISAFGAVTAAGGNSRAARSARAKLQWRDRFGRWIEMGRGVKFKIRFPDGSPRSVIGKFVGAKDAETGQVYVSKDPNGLPDGFYSVKSSNAQEMIADLSPEDLKARGIGVGVDQAGNRVGERMSEDIPNASEIERTDAPVGWKKLPETFGGKNVIETDDGDFRVHFGGKNTKWIVEDKRAGGGTGTAYSNPGDAFEQVQKADDGRVDLKEGNDQKVAQLGRDELIDSIKLNERTISNERASIDAKQRAMTQNEQIKKDLADKGFDPYDPEGNDSDEALAARKAQTPAPAEDTTDAVTSTPGAIDTETFGVEAQGFLVPTGKKTNDISAEGLAQHIEAEMEHYSEGGKRIVVDTDLGEAEGYNSADTFDNAKAQAGGVGTDHVIDLAAGKVEQVDAPENVDSSGTGEGNGEVRDSDAVEPQGSDAGATSADDNGVGGEAEPADSDTNAGGDSTDNTDGADDGDGPSDPNRRAAGVFRKPDEVKSERETLTRERDNNQRALQNTGNRNVMDRLIQRMDEINTRLDELDREDSERDAAEAPQGETQNEAGSVEELETRRSQLQAALENTGDTKDMIALNEQIDALDNRISAAKALQGKVSEEGGASVGTDLLTEPTDGYMVAVQGHNLEIPEDEFFGEGGALALVEWMDANRDALKAPGAHVGLWHDKDNREVVFDVSERVESLEEAERLGKERNQQAVWDVANGVEINTGGTGDRQEAPDSRAGELGRDDAGAEARVGEEGPGDSSSGEVDPLQAVEDAERDIDAANGQEKLDAGRPDDLTRGEVDALDTERRGWAEVMNNDEGREDKYAGLTPDQIAGDVPYVNGQPDFYQESPEAMAGFAKVMDFLEEPLNEGGMFDRLTPEELEAFKEATAKDRAWVNAKNNWDSEARPAWVGPNGETAQEAVDNALSAPTGREQRQNLENLYAGMDRYEREVFDRDREAFKRANPDHRQPAALPDEDAVAENEAARQAVRDGVETARMDRDENPNFQALESSARGTTLSVNYDATGGRRTDTYTKGNDGRWIHSSSGRSQSSDALWRSLEGKNAEFDFGTPESSSNEMSRQEWQRRTDRISELQDAIDADNEALDDLDEEDPQYGEAQDRLTDNVMELNNLLITTPSAAEMDERDGTELEEKPLPTELQDLETVYSDDGFLPDLETLSDAELEDILDAINRLNARGKDDAGTRAAEETIRGFLPESDERVARHEADRQRILEADPLQRLETEIAENQAAQPTEDQELEADRALLDAQVGNLGDDEIRNRIMELERLEADGTANGDDENELAALRDESLRRQQAANAVDEALDPESASPLSDEEFAELDQWIMEDIMAKEALEEHFKSYNVGDIIVDERGRTFEVVGVEGDSVRARSGDLEISVNDEGFDRVYDSEKKVFEEILSSNTSRMKRAQRILNEVKFAEENPSKSAEKSKRSVAKIEAAGKDMDEDVRRSIDQVLADPGTSEEELDDVRSFIGEQPNASNTETVGRADQDVLQSALAPLASQQDAPDANPEFDILWQGVLDAFPEAIVSPEGDLIIDRIEDFRTPAKRNNKINKDYDLRIRRTGNNTAFVYVLETDTVTGERKALRLSPATHSWETFAGRLVRAQAAFRNPKLHITVSRSESTEHLGTTRDVGENPLREYLENGVRPNSADEVFNAVANTVIDRLLQGEKFGKVVDGLRKMDEVDTDAVNRVAQAFIAQMMAPNAAGFKPRDVHMSYDGTKVEAGMRFEWTDHRQFLDWYKPTMRKNPDYLKVYRGTVIALKDEHSDGKGRRYGDDLVIQFDKGQGKNTNQGSLAAQAIRIITDDSAPVGEPFEAKRDELNTPEKIAAAFGLPAANGKTASDVVASVPRSDVAPEAGLPLQTLQINRDKNTVRGYPGVRVPVDQLEAAEKLENAEKTNKSFSELAPGDMIVALDEYGDEQIQVVLKKTAFKVQTGASKDGRLEVFLHKGLPTDYLVATPNWDIIETPDWVQEDHLITANGRTGNVTAIGNGYAMVSFPGVFGSERVDFDDLEEFVESPEVTNLRRQILERLEGIESGRVYDSLFQRLLDPKNATLPDLDRLAEEVNAQNVADDSESPSGGMLAGSLGLPGEVIDRILSRLDTPERFVADYKPRMKRKPMPKDFDEAMSVLRDESKFTQIDMDSNGYSEGTRIVVSGGNGVQAVLTLLKDSDAWGEDERVRVEAVKGAPTWRGRVPGGSYIGQFTNLASAVYSPTAQFTIEESEADLVTQTDRIRVLTQGIRDDFSGMLREFLGGWKVDFVPGQGNMHEMAQGVTTNGGQKIFMKRSPERVAERDGHREFLSIAVARAIGFDQLKASWDEGSGTFLMNVVDGDVAAVDTTNDYRAGMDIYNSYNGWMMGMLDSLIGNYDRHEGNYMFTKDGQLVPIDHGLAAFKPGSMPLDGWAGRFQASLRDGSAPLTTAQLLRMRNEIAALLPFFAAMGRLEWYDAVMANMDTLVSMRRSSEGAV